MIDKPVLENLMPFRKKHTTISSAERIFNRTHCVPNIMNNSLFEPLRNDVKITQCTLISFTLKKNKQAPPKNRIEYYFDAKQMKMDVSN